MFDGNAANIEGYRSTGIDGFLISRCTGISTPLRRTGAGSPGKAVVSGSMYSNHNHGHVHRQPRRPRFVNRLDEPARGPRALAVTMTYTGIPVLYYGTEIALPGGYDPDNRKDMVFEENEITRAVRKLTGIGRNPELVYGDIDLIGLGGRVRQRTYGARQRCCFSARRRYVGFLLHAAVCFGLLLLRGPIRPFRGWCDNGRVDRSQRPRGRSTY